MGGRLLICRELLDPDRVLETIYHTREIGVSSRFGAWTTKKQNFLSRSKIRFLARQGFRAYKYVTVEPVDERFIEGDARSGGRYRPARRDPESQ